MLDNKHGRLTFKTNAEGYRLVFKPDHPRATNGNHGYVYEHILIAETALGKYIPIKHPVHHQDENNSNNQNSNLVICESHKYHMLLHARMRVLKAGYDPNLYKICTNCKIAKMKMYFTFKISSHDNLDPSCVQCNALVHKLKKLNKRIK